jgi:hypothetical protein
MFDWPGRRYGVTFYEGVINPRLPHATWNRIRARCPQCGLKKAHKMDCSRR